MEPTSWEPIRILIVDDHPVVRHGLRNLLSTHPDFEIIGEAEDGAQVFPLLAENVIDLILLDIQMKGQGGIDVARRVLQAYPRVKIIILTTYDDEIYLEQGLQAGVHGFLLKSVSHETLPDAIRAVMRGEKLLSPSLVGTVMSNYQKLAQEHAKQKAGLSADDLKILSLIAEGGSNKSIAEEMFWSEATVKRRVQEILEKLNVSNRAQAIAEAVRQGWI
ncbi:MAG: response regulator transcription factor [Chloroflexota bacterium]|nr:MAG: response regulator transcription factor [Chloroflexota bacterium]